MAIVNRFVNAFGTMRNTLTLAAMGLAAVVSSNAQAQVRISQLFGSGGAIIAGPNSDYLELYNAGGSAVDFSVTNYQISYAAATGTSWSSRTINAGIIPAGGYFLIQLAPAASTSTQLLGIPADFITPTLLDMAQTAGKVALYSAVVAPGAATCPSTTSLADFVGYGTTANCTP